MTKSRKIPSLMMIFESFCEILLTAVLINIPIFLSIIWRAIGKNGIEIDSALELFISDYSYGDILSYTAGLLASSTAWFILNAKLFSNRPGRAMFLVCAPLVILFFAAPVFLREQSGQIANKEFTTVYVQIILGLSFIIWWVSLYNQRALPVSFDTGGNQAVQKITDEIGAKR